MQSRQMTWEASTGWAGKTPPEADPQVQWVLVFGDRDVLQAQEVLSPLRTWYPHAHISGCSTAGEICGTDVRDHTVVATAVRFEHTQVRMVHTSVNHAEESYRAGTWLASELASEDLAHVMVFSDGLHVNGTALVDGLHHTLRDRAAVTGGLAGDGARFQKTLVCCGDQARENRVTAIGFYGDRLQVGYGSLGGWDSFGPDRLITRAQGNVLYELDGQPALALYKAYLGPHVAELPSSALLFPLALRGGAGSDDVVVRTVLNVDEAQGSMTFAGDMPVGTYARLMKANFDRLVDGAVGAARAGVARLGSTAPELAVLISCVGRKLVLKQRVEEEVESVREILGLDTVVTGFYSYGEICPNGTVARCTLHNQTMTVTTFTER